MNTYASPLLLPVMIAVFVVFSVVGTIATSAFGRGQAAAGRVTLGAVWFFGAAAITFLGYRQYGLPVVLPGTISVGVSVAAIYFIAGHFRGQPGWLHVAAAGCIAGLVATGLLAASLLLLLMLFGIDGP
jgi:hypothetical protein